MSDYSEEFESVEDHLEIYKGGLSHFRSVQLEQGADTDYYEDVKLKYPHSRVDKLKDNFQSVRTDFLSSINVLEHKFLNKYEQLLEVQIAIDKEKKQIEKLVGVKASAENLFKIDSLALQKKAELESRFEEKRLKNEKELLFSQKKSERKISRLNSICQSLESSYQVLKDRYVAFKKQFDDDRNAAQVQFKKQCDEHRLSLAHVINEMSVSFEYYRQFALQLRQKELVFTLQLDVRLDLVNQYFFRKKKVFDQDCFDQQQKFQNKATTEQEKLKVLYDSNQKRFDKALELMRIKYENELASKEIQFSDSLKLEQEKSRRFFDKTRSFDDNNVEKAKQAGVNLKHDYSNQVEKIQHELDLKRHAEEAALQVELNQLRHLKSEALAHEFCQKRELVQKKFQQYYDVQLETFRQKLRDQCRLLEESETKQDMRFRQKYELECQTVLQLKQAQKKNQLAFNSLQEYVGQLQKRYEREVYLNRELTARCDQYVNMIQQATVFNRQHQDVILADKKGSPIILRSSKS
mgnify:CR=1 FL=1